ncbi:MAG: penicillin-binding transpeptidase domain-containing protein [Eubacteriales bacterium]
MKKQDRASRKLEKINKKNKKRLKREVMFTTYFFVFLFMGMIGYLVHFVATNEQELINNSYNSRQELLTAENYRGSIYSADGELLAYTDFLEDGSEIREYPYENLFSHIVGFSTKGKTGIESLANYYLINSNISLSTKISNEVAGEKNPGDNVYTTLDTQLQQIASDYLGVYKGAVIVTEVETGKILAMVSKPDFDPNTIVSDWDDYVADTETSVLLNRATQGIYPPGSTFKIITALQYIRENPDTYSNYSYQCNGIINFADSSISCYHGSVHGSVNLMTSFAKSCNTSFTNIGLSLDKDSFQDTLTQLQFNQNLPLDINYSKSSLTVSEDTSDDNMMQISIGQGIVQMTPIHLHLITSAVANDGVVMTPYVLDKVIADNGTTVKQFSSKAATTYMSTDEAAILRGLMEDVVLEGTATKLDGLSYTAAGKTGSAEFNAVAEDSHAWFTGFAPVDDPEIAITIIVEGIGSGGDYAVPIAKRLFDCYFSVE